MSKIWHSFAQEWPHGFFSNYKKYLDNTEISEIVLVNFEDNKKGGKKANFLKILGPKIPSPVVDNLKSEKSRFCGILR